MGKNKSVTTTEAACLLGVSRSWLRHLIAAGKLKAEKIGRDWAIDATHIEGMKEKKAGRPRGGPRMD